MTEDQLEQDTLTWLCDVGYTPVFGPDIAIAGIDDNIKLMTGT